MTRMELLHSIIYRGDKIMEIVLKDTHFFINNEFDQRLPVIELYPLGID
jgi:hypothetical protein